MEETQNLIPQPIKRGRLKGLLTSEEQIKLVTLIACWKKQPEIQKEFSDKRISVQLIDNYRSSSKWKSLINEIREKYNRSVSEIPLANTRKRVEELSEIFYKQKERGRLECAVGTLKAIHDELDEKVPHHISFVQNNQFSSLTQEEIEEKRLEVLQNLEAIRRKKHALGITEATDSHGNSGARTIEAIFEEQGDVGNVSPATS